jgi:hypothetical protein
MAFFLFVDESGLDRRESPCEVLAGISVEDRDLWNLIDAINDAEERILGMRYGRQRGEFKGKTFLKKKVFRQAVQLPMFEADQRRELSRGCLERGDSAGRDQITALAQAKLAFVQEVFDLCARYHCQAFASIVTADAPRPLATVLRKDYAFLFERFFYYLEDRGPTVQGAVVFDELERAQSNVLLGQMEEYFLHTARGRIRSRQVIPQPFFVHSDLTTLIQVSDLLAYTISWGFRLTGTLDVPAREELKPFADQVAALRYSTTRDVGGNPQFTVWSFAVIRDLRGWEDRQGTQE